MCLVKYVSYKCNLPFNYLTLTETETEDNILSPSPETLGNDTPIDENTETTNEGKSLL